MFLWIILAESVIITSTLCQIVGGINDHCNNILVEFNRAVHRKGYHRELITDANIMSKEVEHNEVGGQLLIIEHFPPGMFIDPYELESKNLLELVSTNEEINIEEPAYRSHSIKVYVYVSLIYGNASIILPVHLRYQRPKYCYTNSSSFYETVLLPSPEVYIAQKHLGHKCSNTVTFPCHKDSLDVCHWIPVKIKKDIPLFINVSVGCIEHRVWVILITSIVIIVMALKVCHTIVTTQRNKHD